MNPLDDKRLHKAHKAELASFINKARDNEKSRGMSDVYITDHTPTQKKYLTKTKADDEAFFRYHQSVKEMNDSYQKRAPAHKPYKSRYPRGSLAQRIFDPLATAYTDENGTLTVDINDDDMSALKPATQTQFEKYSVQEEIEIDDEDEMLRFVHEED